MAYTTIDDPSAHFHTELYTGDGQDNRTVTNSANAGDFKPDWLWIKERSATSHHRLFDSSRGVSKRLATSNNEAEVSDSSNHKTFDTDGFTVGTSGSVNANSDTYAAWQWKANGGTTSSNGNGSVTSTVQANTTAGFSIVTYTGTGSGNTIGHGLGVTPDLIIVKVRSTTNNWGVWHKDLGGPNYYLKLNTTDSTITATDVWNNTLPTSTVFSTGSAGTSNDSGETYVAYCFTEIQGYSKFGSYRGNISSGDEGMFVYTGFKPAWLMVKSTSNSGQEWVIFDNKRDPFNVADAWIYAQTTTVEDSGGAERDVDFLSNGFKFRNAGGPTTYDGRTYIYLAFAEHPFVSSEGVPITAR